MSDDKDHPALFDVEPDWAETWKGMPSYDHKDLMPDTTLLVHFRNQNDRRAFAKFVNQQLNPETKFIWYPKAEIVTAADKVYASQKVTPRYPVYIISKGRADTRLTAKCFEWIKVPYHIVIEPQEYDQYAAVIDPKKILTLPFSNLGLGGIPARNWVWEHAVATGAERHWIFDDNISGFCRFQDNLKVEVDSGVLHCAIEDFSDRYENVVMSGFNYDYFAPRKQGSRIRPYTLNTRIYSGILLSNKIPHRWRGRYNEDTDLSLRILKDGLCTVLFNAFLMYKKPTLTMKGGNTDELYAGVNATAAEWELHAKDCADCTACLDGYASKITPCETGRQILEKDGRWRMAEHLREQHPDITTVERKWQRWQHQVDYRQFVPDLGKNVLRLREGVVLTDDNKYEMTLGAMEPDVDADRPKPQGTSPAPRKPSPKPEQQPDQAPAGPSALAFVLGQPRPEPAPVAASPSSPPAGQGETSQAKEKPSLPEPGQPGPPPTAGRLETARRLKAGLEALGHRVLTRDGKLLVSEASKLSDADRAAVKAWKPELLTIADPWIEPVAGGGMAGVSRPSADNAERMPPSASPASDWTLKDAVPQQSLASFLGTQSTLRVSADWKPDEPPSLDGIDEIVLNFATTGLDWAHGHRPIGVTVSTLDGQLTRFLPFAFEHGGNLDEGTIKEWVRREVRGKRIINAKTRFDVHHSREWGVDLEEQGCTFSDIQHTAALLDDHRKRFALDVLVKDYLPNDPMVERVFVGEGRHAEHHASEVAEREYFTAQAVAKLRAVMYPQVDEQDLREIHDLEDAVIPCVVEMEKNGAPLDLELLDQMHKECHAKHDELMWDISKEVGFAFEHTASGWKRLLEHYSLAVPESFSESVLRQVDHPLVRKGQKAAQYSSLASKTFDAYKKNVGSDGILRFDINQLYSEDGGTVSGRFSIGYVQQVPNHDNHHAAFGDALVGVDDCIHSACNLYPRRLFIAGEGEYLEADAAQIEYRLFAHYSNNAEILAAYQKDPRLSFHKMTWAMMKEYKADMLYSHQKSFNFAKQYGARSIKLAVMMGMITEKEGDEIRANKAWNDPRLNLIHEIEAAYKRMMPEGDELLERAGHLAKPSCDKYCRQGDAMHKKYQHRGFVKTLRGRRSRFPTHYKTYIGLNRVLQGTGADYMKKKLVELHAERKHTNFLMRLTVHDAVGGDARTPETLDRVNEILNVQSFPELKVRILWDSKTGKNWAACK